MSNAQIAFRALIRKDLVTFLRDRRALVVSIATPIFIAGFFGFLFGGSGDAAAPAHLPVALVDQDGSVLSKAVIADLQREAVLDAALFTREAARDLVRSGKRRGALILPQGFGAAAPRALFGGAGKPPVELLYDPSQAFVRPILEGLLTQHVMQEVTRAWFSPGAPSALVDESLQRLRANGQPPESRRELIDLLEAVRHYQSRAAVPAGEGADAPASAGMAVPFTIASEAVTSGPHYNSYAHSFAGMSVQFILFMGIDAGIALLLMRGQGMWQRLRAAPLSRSLLLGSRVVSTALIALLILCIVYAAAFLIFDVRVAGSMAGFVCVAIAFALLAASIGLVIAAIGGSVAATRGLAIFVSLILVMLGGAWVPAFLFPDWLQQVSKLVPTRWAVDGFDAMTWRGLPFDAAVMPTAVLLGWSALLLAIAVWRFDWDAD